MGQILDDAENSSHSRCVGLAGQVLSDVENTCNQCGGTVWVRV